MDENNLGQIAPFLARSGRNYCPSEPILRLQNGEARQPLKLEIGVKNKYKEYLDYQKTAWDELIAGGQMVALMCRGEHMLEKRRYGVGWYIRPVQESDSYRKMTMNFMGFYRHACVTKILSVSPTVNVTAADDDPRSIAAAKSLSPVIDYWEEKLFTERFRWRTALDILNNGTRLHRVRWNPFLPGPTKTTRQIQEQPQTTQGYGACQDCPHEGPPSDFQNPELSFGGQCPKCGSNAVQVTPDQTSIIHKIVAGQAVSSGGPEVLRMGLAACRWDLRYDAEESSWFIYRQKIKVGDVKLLIGDAILPDTVSSEDKSLDVLERLAYAGLPMEGYGSSGLRHVDKTPTLCEFWMSPEDYSDIQVEETKTVSGDTLPKGRMSDLFKGPICVVGLNDMSLIIGIYAESHRDQIVSTQWLLDADSGTGRGLQDAAATQKRFNAADGHIFQGLAQHATPGVMVDKRILTSDQGDYLFRPGHTTDVNLTQLHSLGIDDLRKAMYIAQPGQVNSQYITYTQEFLKSAFQVQTFAIEFSDQFMNIDPRTATGSNLISSLASSLFGPMARVNADAHVSLIEKVVCLLAKYDKVGRYYPHEDGSRGVWVCSADLDGKLSFGLESGSQTPSSPALQQQAWSSMTQSVGGVEGLIALHQQMPNVFKQLIKTHNLKIEAEDPDTISEICLGRLDQMKKMLAGGISDPEIIINNLIPPVSMVEPKHGEKMQWFSSFLDSEEGLESPMPLRQCAERMYFLHQNLMTQQQMPQAANQGLVAGVHQAAAAAPSALGQQHLQRMNPQPVDEKSARGFLKQAGGDKNKARKLALRGGR